VVHTLLVAVHAASGALAFFAGCALLVGRAPARGSLVLAGATTVMAATLTALVITDAPDLEPPQGIVFSGLVLLAVVLVARAGLALREVHRRRTGWRSSLLPHAGFVVVSLLDAFVVVSAVDLRLPPAAVSVVAVLAAVPGVVLVRRAVRRERDRAARP
jgi:hypothetical protein